MIPRMVDASHEQDDVAHIRFADGTEGDVDLRDDLYSEVFEPLKAPGLFAKVAVHPGFYTLCWPNGADFAPGFLCAKVQVPA